MKEQKEKEEDAFEVYRLQKLIENPVKKKRGVFYYKTPIKLNVILGQLLKYKLFKNIIYGFEFGINRFDVPLLPVPYLVTFPTHGKCSEMIDDGSKNELCHNNIKKRANIKKMCKIPLKCKILQYKNYS